MRSAYLNLLIVFLITVSSIALSKPLNVQEIFKESDSLKKKISAQKSLDGKKAELKKLEDLLQSTMKMYEAESPAEGSKEEDQVNRLFFAMEPIFDMAKVKVSKTECEKADHRIRLEDRDMTKKDPSELSPQAKEAIAILKLFCTL